MSIERFFGATLGEDRSKLLLSKTLLTCNGPLRLGLFRNDQLDLDSHGGAVQVESSS